MKSLNNISIKGLYLLLLACMMIGTQGKLFSQPPPPPPPAASFIPDTITSVWSCSTHQATVHISIDSSYVHLPVTYQWSTGDTTPTVTLTQGVYYVTMVDDSSVTSIDSVVISGSITANAGPSQSLCLGNSATIGGNPTGSGGTGSYTYSWSPVTGLNAANIANPLATPAASTTYTVMVTDQSGCSASASMLVTVSSCTFTAGPDQTVCVGPVTMAAIGTGTWAAVTSNPGITNFTSSSSPTTTITGFSTGGYYYFIWTTISGADTVIVNYRAQPSPPFIVLWGGSNCLNDSLAMGIAIGDTAYWMRNGNPYDTMIAHAGVLVYRPSQPGSYSVYLATGCGVRSVISDTIQIIACTDSVWPGDADNNRLVDNLDLLPIGLAYDSTGPVRTTQGIVWQGDAATDWAHSFAAYSPRLNYKYADCNGDGIVNLADTSAIMQNFSLTHNKTRRYTASGRSSLPPMKLVFSKDTVLRGDTLIVSILLGDSNTHVNGIYGLAFTFNYDQLIYDSTTTGFAFPTSWLGTAGHSISISKDFHSMGMVKCAITGIDHLSRTGFGKIAQYRGIITTDNINGKNLQYHHNLCYISDIKAIDIHGDTIAIGGAIDSSYVGYVPNGISEIETAGIKLYPNPALNQIRVTAAANISEIVISDMLGQEVQTIKVSNRESEMIDISQLGQGVYIIRVRTQSGIGSAKMIIAR